jgi:drug/metabolite transporter (DMT)-like permease
MEEGRTGVVASERLPTAKMVDERKRGSPLAAIFLLVVICAVLLALPDRNVILHTVFPENWIFEFDLCCLAGSFMAFLLAAYCTESGIIIVASCIIGAAIAPVAIAVLQTTHDLRWALIGAALILVFAIVVRLAERKPPAEPLESNLPTTPA